MSQFRCTGTLDIECASWDRFAVAATYTPEGGSRIHKTIVDLCDWLLASPGCYWAHCGGTYDFLAIAEELRRRSLPCTVDLAGHRISRLVCGRVTLRDSYALVPFALDVAAPLAGARAPSLSFACTCGGSCGGYCTIRPGDRRPALAEYVAQDAYVLWQVLEAIQEHAATLGLHLRGTIGGTAWATAKALLELPDADFEPAQWRAIRKGYYGGRVQIFRPIARGPGSHWDISSAYPAALASVELPIGACDEYGSRLAAKCLALQRPGIYTVTIEVPESFVPPLPIRDGHYLAYPYGVLRGSWTLPEIELALARGALLIEVHDAMVFDGTVHIFGALIRHWFEARAAVGKKSPLGQWLRLLANSFTGKLAEGPDRRSVRMFPDSIVVCPMTRPCSRQRCSGACGAYEQLDHWGQVWSVPFYRPAQSGHVHWAAYLTAATRAAWLAGAESQGESLVYGDTDSLWTTSRVGPRPQGRQLGAWEYKHSWTEWQCVAPRAYRYRSDDGGAIVRTAGMSVTDDEWLAGRAEHARGVMGFVEAARASSGLFRRSFRKWTMPARARDSGLYGDRLLDERNGITYAREYGVQKETHQRSART